MAIITMYFPIQVLHVAFKYALNNAVGKCQSNIWVALCNGPINKVTSIRYQMPLALVGLISCLALWDLFRFWGDRWGLDRYPLFRLSLVRVAQCATAVILFFSNVQMTLSCALGVSYAVLILHASFRKLTPTKRATEGGRSK
ncbi:unnamed protein product [Ilex paraguariensis]|uniref:PRA1 family protein n=1 Tax=Ilex paraguariensis TaxID=185542 RepID=A0ABC8U1M5_9AQUA